MTARFRRVAGLRAGGFSFSGSNDGSNGRPNGGPGAGSLATARLALAQRIALGASACFLGACSDGGSSRSIDSSRTVSRAGLDLSIPSSTSQQLGLAKSPHGAAPATTHDDHDPALKFTTPNGWKELAATSMRLANFQVAGDPRAECYLTLLGGDGGGMASNVNRWRAQMSLPAATASELDALPKSTFLGQEAAFVDLRGTWKGMSGANSANDWRLLGLVLVEPGGSAFLKMTGPDTVLEKERDAFLELARSIRIENGIDENAGDLQTALAAARAGQDPHAGMAITSPKPAPIATGAPINGSGVASTSGLGWSVPSGWTRAPEKPSRLVTFYAGEEALECYVTVLPGDAGGALANVNRWRGQLELGPIDERELASAATLPMLGASATYVDFEAPKDSGGSKAGTRMLAAALNTPQRSVFVKLMGPSDRVAAQRGAFEVFAGSLVEAR